MFKKIFLAKIHKSILLHNKNVHVIETKTILSSICERFHAFLSFALLYDFATMLYSIKIENFLRGG